MFRKGSTESARRLSVAPWWTTTRRFGDASTRTSSRLTRQRLMSSSSSRPLHLLPSLRGSTLVHSFPPSVHIDPCRYHQAAFFSEGSSRQAAVRKQERKAKKEHRKQKEYIPKPSDDSDATPEMIRLSKRMSELDICSRREADRYIMEGRVMMNNHPVEPILGQKILADETNIVLLKHPYHPSERDNQQSIPKTQQQQVVQRRALEFSWSDFQSTTVVLHKPLGYVSGQPDEGPKGNAEIKKHIPAVRLLTPTNAFIDKGNYQDGDNNPQTEYQEAIDIVRHKMKFQTFRATQRTTLQNYVPAGRLDLNSSGLLLFTNSGVMAKKLISPEGLLEKEYLVLLEAVQNLTRHERESGMTYLPVKPKPDKVDRILKGGHTLWGDHKPMRPAVDVEWLDLNEGLAHNYFPLAAESQRNLCVLRLVLKEGRKHQVRRMCRELLGMHVVDLIRTRIGPIELNSVPEGKWRPLRQHEAELIYHASSSS